VKTRVTVWNEFRHERRDEHVRAIYPEGLHRVIADAIGENEQFEVRTATLDEPEQGLPQEVLETTDVLVWWGHMAHQEVADELVERIACRVRDGMGIIVLHSGHYSKIFRRLMGTECRSKWWECGDKERIFTILPGHPIAAGLPEFFELREEETYCEHFNIPVPDELVFLSWFSGGAVLRSGCCYHYGAGKVFYFQPGHEEFPIYYDENIRRVLRNAAGWAAPAGRKPVYGKFDRLEGEARRRLESVSSAWAVLRPAYIFPAFSVVRESASPRSAIRIRSVWNRSEISWVLMKRIALRITVI